jgi:hypothetical protein
MRKLLVLFTFFLFLIPTVRALSYTDNNITAYYTLDVDGTDRTNKYNLGTLGSPYLTTAGCQKGNCYMFIDNIGDDFSGDITRANPSGIGAWINRTGSDNEEMYAIGWGTGDGAIIHGDANANGGWGCNVQASLWGSSEMERNKWYYMFCYSNGTGVDLYVNGTHVGSRLVAGDTGLKTVNIGNAVTNYPFEGQIDEVMITNGTMTDADVLSLYNSYFATTTTTTIPIKLKSNVSWFGLSSLWRILVN